MSAPGLCVFSSTQRVPSPSPPCPAQWILMQRTPAPGAVSAVRPGSLAEEAGIEAGDAIVSVDGRILRDVVDFQFYAAANEVQVAIKKANGLDDLVLFEKEIDED